jgi:hypothetical protein
VIGSGITTAESDGLPNKEAKRERLASRYGKPEAKAGIAIMDRLWKEKEREGYSHEEYHERVTEALLDHPIADVIAEDVQQSVDSIKAARKERQGKDDVSKPLNVGTASASGTQQLDTVTTNTSQSGLGVSSVEFIGTEPYTNLLPLDEAKVRAFVPTYGTGKARLRTYGYFLPEETGAYKFTTTYYREGKVEGGSATVSLYTDQNGVENFKSIEEPAGEVSGNTAREKSFELQKGDPLFVGVEYSVSASTAGGVPLADFRDNSRRFEPNKNGPKTPELEWEFFG